MKLALHLLLVWTYLLIVAFLASALLAWWQER